MSDSNINLLNAALSFAARGFPVFPAQPDKKPYTLHGYKDATTDPDRSKEWFERWPDARVAIPTGPATGLVVIDTDSPHAEAELQNRGFDPGPAAKTRRGVHRYFRHPGGYVKSRQLFDGCDIKADGGYVLAAPSPGYSWEVELNGNLPDLPEWVLEAAAAERPTYQAGEPIPDGQRNDRLTRLGGAMRRFGADFDIILDTLLKTNATLCRPPLEDEEVEQVARSVMRYQPAEERPHLTDLGNAQRLVEFHGDDLRYVAAWRKWLVWDGTRWAVDDTGEVYRRAEEAVRLMYREASLMQDSGDRKKLSGWARQSEAKKRIDNMIALAQFQPGIAITPDDLDNDIWLLNAQNGTVDLRTGHLRTHNRDDLITKLAPVHYDPNAECPTFKAFLERVLPSEDLRRFVQRAVGYSLTGDVSERALFILHGTGKNGKSTLLETIRAALGDYALQTPAETLMAKSAGGIPNDVARLKGSRFVSASETEAGHRLAESTVKQLTGNDTISARFMRAEWFDFRPTHKIFLATNHRPEIRGTDNAIWDRIKLVPFDVRIPASEQDPRLLETLKGELPGILRWAVEGCIEWQRGGLEPPVEVQMATDTYRADMDPLAQFIDDCLVYSRDAVTPSSLIWNRYLSWAEENYERPVNRRIFTDRLKAEDGFEPLEQSVWVGGKKQRAWKGVDVVREIANAA